METCTDRFIETHAATHRTNHRPYMLLCRACLQVVAKVWGYRKVWLQSHRVFETGLFSLPPMEYHTRGLFVHLPLGLQQEVSLDGWMDGSVGVNIHVSACIWEKSGP